MVFTIRVLELWAVVAGWIGATVVNFTFLTILIVLAKPLRLPYTLLIWLVIYVIIAMQCALIYRIKVRHTDEFASRYRGQGLAHAAKAAFQDSLYAPILIPAWVAIRCFWWGIRHTKPIQKGTTGT